MIFVFGSNLAGVHGAGAALTALRDHGAVKRQGSGRMGNSYAIPTKDAALRSLSLADIAVHVDVFLGYARTHAELEFEVTQIGCGLAGYRAEQIAPLFCDAPPNCYFDQAWQVFLPQAKTWGTYCPARVV